MIVGIGTDLCDQRRIERLHRRFGARFENRLLHPDERPARISPQLLAKRFAAKEAVVKAMGTAFRHGLFLKDVRIMHAPSGQPVVVLSAKAQAFLPPGCVVHLSLADEHPYALAFAVVAQAPGMYNTAK